MKNLNVATVNFLSCENSTAESREGKIRIVNGRDEKCQICNLEINFPRNHSHGKISLEQKHQTGNLGIIQFI